MIAAGRATIAGAVLAAGGSRRLGQPKQLVRAGDDPLVRAACRAVLATCDRAAVVLGAAADHIAPAVADLPIDRIDNLHWREGVAASIRCATAWAAQIGADALLLVVCDQPRLAADHLARLVAAFRADPRAVGSRYGGATGTPALFPRGAFAALARLRGDIGARGVLAAGAAHAIDWPAGELDIDVPADLHRLAR